MNAACQGNLSACRIEHACRRVVSPGIRCGKITCNSVNVSSRSILSGESVVKNPNSSTSHVTRTSNYGYSGHKTKYNADEVPHLGLYKRIRLGFLLLSCRYVGYNSWHTGPAVKNTVMEGT